MRSSAVLNGELNSDGETRDLPFIAVHGNSEYTSIQLVSFQPNTKAHASQRL